jgi:Ca2+-dependent lipid-binding protein
MGACLRKPPTKPVVIETEDAPATALAPDDLTKPPNALHVRIIRARDLPAVDTNLLSKNSSDPYVLLECCGERARTTTKKKQLNPDYGEAFLLSRDEDEPLSLVVMDADVLSSDDMMCSCTVQIQGREPVKQWYDLTHNGEQKGRIQVVTHLVYDAVEFSERARLPPMGDGMKLGVLVLYITCCPRDALLASMAWRWSVVDEY